MSLSSILFPLEWIVAWIMVSWHTLLSWLGLPAANGWTWVLSIVGLVLVIRTLLIPLFVRQIRASRSMQLIQPDIKKIQQKYKGRTDPDSRQAMAREQMELYKTSKTNPFASCLPLLLQMPIFFALFRVLNGISQEDYQIGPFTSELRAQADSATIFGAQLSDTFLRAETLSTQIIVVVLVVLMSGSQFWSQRQLFMKNMPPAALDGPFAQQQKLLLYVLPVVFAISGLWFPLGVLIYWLVTNLFSTAQQFVVIQQMPAPGSPAEKALLARRARKAARRAERGQNGGRRFPLLPGRLTPAAEATTNGGTDPTTAPDDTETDTDTGGTGTGGSGGAGKPGSGKSGSPGGGSGKGRGGSARTGRPVPPGGSGGSGGGRSKGPSGQRPQPKRNKRSRRKRR